MKSVGICNALLRVLLSVALVVSFTPIPASAGEDATGAGGSPSASVGEQGSALSEGSGEAALTGGAAVEVVGAAADAGGASSGSDAESPAGEGGDDTATDASSPVGEGADSASPADKDAGEGADAASPEGGEAGSKAAGEAADAADDPAERAAGDEPAQQGVLYPFGKLMASGYVYACDERGDLTKPVDEDDPERNAISARDVTNLIVDYHVANIPKGLCEGSTSLTSVRFENDRLDSIGDFAFAACAKLSFISFSDMHIGSIGAQAFAGCSSLTSLSIKKPAEIGALGEGCFLKSGLESTGLGNVKGLTSIPADAYEGCQNLSDTGLGQNQQIASVGNWAFANCPNLHVTGLETNTSVSQLGDGCFSGSNLDGGLILPNDSRIELLPSRTFAGTNLDYAYFQCDHAVLIDVDTFPKRGMQVMVPSDLVGLYRSGFPELNWDGCNGATPVSVFECLRDLRIEHDPNVMEYAEDDKVSLAGMKVTFNHGYGRSSFDYEDLKNCAFAQFIEVYPDDGYLFRSSFHGQRIHMTYDDGEVYLDAYSAEPMRERGNTDLAVDIRYDGALSSGDSATGAGQYKPGETCVVVANATTPGRTFAYWTDEQGNILSEDQRYEFTVERDTLLTAVFADKATVAPEVRLGSADGRQVIGAKASVLVDGRDMGTSFTTYSGKAVTLTCEYDASKYRLDHWESSLDKHYLGSRPGDTIEYEAVAGETPIAVLVEYGQLNVSAESASGTYELGQTVKLSAIPEKGCRFLGWMHRGELLSTEASYAYRVQDFDEVTGWFAFDFSQTWVAVRAASAQPDRGSVSGAGMYEEGTKVTLTATPNAGYAFAGWLRDGEPIEGGAKLVVTAESADQTDALVKRSPLYTATFEPISCKVSYEQTLDTGGRGLMEGVEIPQVTGSLSTEGGLVVTLDAKALGMLDDDTVFAGWFDAATGERVCESPVYEFTPAGDITLQARFSLKEVGVHINPAQTTDHSESYAHLQVDAANCYRNVGETVQLSATPDNAQFVGWYAVDGDDSVAISDQATCEYEVTKPANESAQVELTPWYSAIPASVVLSVAGTDEDGNAPGYFLTSGLYGVGQQVTVNAVPEPGYVFDYATDALGNTVPAASDGSYTFLLTGDTELVAHFRVAQDEDEAFEALQIALLAVLGTVGIVAAVYGLGEIVDPIIAQAMIDIAGAETIEELAQIGKNVLKEIKDIFDHHKHDNDPNKPHGDHSVEILATAQPAEGGIVRGGGIHFEGTIAELEAIPNPGYRFVCWKEDGIERSVSQRMQIRITDATPEVVAMTAVFERNVRITTSAEVTGVDAGIPTGCNATPDVQTPRQGQEAKVIATEGEGYAFVGWFQDGIEVSKSPVYVFPAEVDRHLVAKFRKADRTIVVGADPDEGAQVLCDGVPVEGGVVRAADGDILTFTAVPAVRADDPDKKYKLVEWRKTDDSGRTAIDHGDVCECRVDGNGRVTAVMDGKDSHSVRAATDPVEGGTATLKNGESVGEVLDVPEGESITATAEAREGYLFDGWYISYGAADVAPTFASHDQTYTFAPVADCTVTARFQRLCKVSVVAEPVDQLAGKYTVTGDGYCVSGKPVTLSVKLSDDVRDKFTFKGWYLGDSGVPMGTDPDHLELTPEQDTVVRAVFVPKRYRISVETDSHLVERGTVEIEGHSGADAVMVEYGSTVTIKANPNEGFRFAHWKDDKRKKHPEQQLTVRVTGDQTYKAVFKGAEPEVVIAADTWLGGTVTCNGIEVTPATDSFSLGQVVHIQARQTDDRRFVGWQLVGADGSKAHFADDADTWFVLDEDLIESLDEGMLELEAQFADPYEVAVKAAPVVKGKSTNRRCRVQGTGAYEAGKTVALNAVAGLGYRFVGWTSDREGHVVVSTDEVLSFEAESDVMYYAQFEADGQVTITASQSSILRGKAFLTSGNGLTSATKTCDKGDMFVAMAIPWSTYRFSHWIDDAGAILSYNAVYVGVAQQDMQLTAVFYDAGFDLQVDTYPASAGFSTVVSFTGDGYLTATWMVTILFPGWRFRYWIDERGAPVGFSPIIVRPAVANKTYTAYYVRDSWNVVAVDPRDGGHIDGSSENDEWGCALVDKVENGSSCTLRAVPDEGYVFDGWYAIGKDGAAGSRPVSTDAAWTFTPEDDVTVTARFAEVPKLEVKASAINGTVDLASAAVPQGGSASFTATPYDGCYLERATVADVRDGSIADSVELDIADYQGGSYRVTLNDIDVPQRLAFSFARAGQPVVKAQPQGASVHEGEAATLSVAADAAEEVLAHEEASCGAASSHELGYQWFRVSDGGEDVALEGETSASLTFDRAAAADAGSYYCRITQTYLGTVMSVETDRAEVSIAKREDLAFNACGLPVATAHSEYVGAIEPATGGTAPYMYAVAPDSALPEGLHLEVAEDGAVRITGTPESAGVFCFDVVCSDSAGQTRSARFALTVAPQKADLSFAEANFVYDGQPQGPELKGVPDGCVGFVKLSFTGTGGTRYSSSTAPTDAGTYRVVARLAANGYVGRAVAEFAIAQKPVSFEIAAADCVYDGNAHGVQVDAHGMSERDYSVTYEGADGAVYGPAFEAPRDSGSYVATARVENPNLVGEQKASFAIAKAPQAITGPTSYSGVFGCPGIVLQNTAKTPVTFELVQDADGGAPVSLQGCYVTINAAGTARVIARAAESRNYLAADDAELTLSVAPAQLLVAVDDAERMEGESNPAFTSSLVSRASTDGVEVRYSCDADEKSPAGDYIITASVDDPNFVATIVPGTLTVKAKPEPGPDPDNPEPGPTPDPDNPDPDPVDPPNPPEPGPGPDPDNPDPGPTPDPDNPEPGPGPDNPDGPNNPDNPEPGPGPEPGPSPDPGPDPVDPGKPDPGPGPGPSPDNPDNPNGPDNPGNPDNPDKPDPSDPSKPGSDPENPGPGPENPDDQNSGNSGSSDDSNGSGGSDSGSSDDSNGSGDPGDPDNPDGSANASVAAALGQTGDAAAKTGVAATGVAALIAAAMAALAAALPARRHRR